MKKQTRNKTKPWQNENLAFRVTCNSRLQKKTDAGKQYTLYAEPEILCGSMPIYWIRLFQPQLNNMGRIQNELPGCCFPRTPIRI